ncbi:MAG: adenosylcobinamide-GDP ribazoletransferase [Ignavibacteriales bacterium]|nr:adenosylcobinamide-GDP ribazoletransferase [Ignavibacteriales bacterium]
MKKEIKNFIASLMFFTRIPLPKAINLTKDDFSQAMKYFPVVGLIIGILSAMRLYADKPYFASIYSNFIKHDKLCYLNRAMHEDGLADTFDAFGGGSSKEKYYQY